MRPLAIIESDSAHAASLHAALEAAGFRAQCFSSGSAALPHVRAQEFALAILDLDLRDTDPFAMCSEARQHLPVIALASACTAETCIRALESGADDCIRRKTSGRELVARVRAILRRSDPAGDGAAHSLALSIAEMRIRASDATHDLTRGETEVLSLLLTYMPAPITALRMAEPLHARRGTVESRIRSLRQKLGPGKLVSRGRLGYQLAEE